MPCPGAGSRSECERLPPAFNQVARWFPSNGISSSRLQEHLEVIGAGVEAACLDQALCYHQAMTGARTRGQTGAVGYEENMCIWCVEHPERPAPANAHSMFSHCPRLASLLHLREPPYPLPFISLPTLPNTLLSPAYLPLLIALTCFSPKLPSSLSTPSHTPVFSHSPLSLSRLLSFQSTQ